MKQRALMTFTHESMQTIMNCLKEAFKTKTQFSFTVLNPDIQKAYAGEEIVINGQVYIYRSLKAWMDLSEVLHVQMKMPKAVNEYLIELTFEKLQSKDSFHEDEEVEHKYGNKSLFSKINKNEEPAFLHYYEQALNNVKINEKKRILNLGVNSAEEFEVIQHMAKNFDELEFVGIDYCQSAINEAKEKFPHKNMTFLQADINALDDLNLGEFDLIISIGTLQSSNLNFNEIFMKIVQNHLKKEGAMILGFPNCRWIDTQMIYGAKIKNYAFSELSNLFKDANFCKKYLQQKKYRVTLTGKHYIFLTATSIRK